MHQPHTFVFEQNKKNKLPLTGVKNHDLKVAPKALVLARCFNYIKKIIKDSNTSSWSQTNRDSPSIILSHKHGPESHMQHQNFQLTQK